MSNPFEQIDARLDGIEALLLRIVEAPDLNKKTTNEELYETPKQVSARLQMSLGTLWNYTKSGRLKSYKIGSGKVLYKTKEVDEAILKMQENG